MAALVFELCSIRIFIPSNREEFLKAHQEYVPSKNPDYCYKRKRNPHPYNIYTDAVIKHLIKCKVKFFYDDADNRYMYVNGKFYIIEYHQQEIKDFFHTYLQMNLVDPEGRNIYEAIRSSSKMFGAKISSKKWLFSKSSGDEISIYINTHSFDDKILKISNNKIESLDNVNNYDNILIMKSPKFKSFVWNENADVRKGLNNMFLSVFCNIPTAFYNRFFLMYHFIATFMLDLFVTIPIIKFTGPTNSGKSKSAELITKLLYGEPYVMHPTVPSIWTDSTINPVIVIDNLEEDNRNKDIIQCLLQIASKEKKQKKNMKDYNAIMIESSCTTLYITSIQPFRQEEVINRLFDINFCIGYKSRDYFYNKIMNEIEINRSDILSSIFIFLSNILERFGIKKLIETKEIINRKCISNYKNRMVDYLSFIYIIMIAMKEYIDAPMENLFDDWLADQNMIHKTTRMNTDATLNLLNRYLDILKGSNEQLKKQFYTETVKIKGHIMGIRGELSQIFTDLWIISRKYFIIFDVPNVQGFSSKLLANLDFYKESGWHIKKEGKIWEFIKRNE